MFLVGDPLGGNIGLTFMELLVSLELLIPLELRILGGGGICCRLWLDDGELAGERIFVVLVTVGDCVAMEFIER